MMANATGVPSRGRRVKGPYDFQWWEKKKENGIQVKIEMF